MAIKILADSTCDLSEELVKRYDITIVPLSIIMGDQSYYDGEDVTPDKIFEWADANKTTPKTAAVSQDRAEAVLRPLIDAGDDIIFFCISSKMSSTCNVIAMVGEGYEKLHVIDSYNLSTGIGLQVIRAAELAAGGMDAASIAERINEDRAKVRASFVIDTLTYLARGGRCSAVTALLANTLRIHPIIEVHDGAMGVAKKLRGHVEHAIMSYVTGLEEDLKNAHPARVFITHSGCSRELVEEVRDYLEGLGVFEEVLETRAGGVISSHCGPNTLGVLFYEK
ncbi:MAG: DegV family protein [Lachnospiraceae bacterium]|nr:DegV family protein [Lachnospiraceae bacterium]